MDGEAIAHTIDQILLEEDHRSPEDSSIERIEALVEVHGWPVVRAHLIAVLEDPARSPEHWEVVAGVFWGATLDRRAIPEDRLIALVYARLPRDPGSTENNLAWSITSKLRRVEYVSDYDPLTDPRVMREMASIRRS